MRTDAHLLAFERTAELATSLLDDVADERLRVVHGCASTVLSELEQHRFGKADAVVSGIPFTNLPEAIATTIIGRVYDALKPGGRFIAYQFTSRVADYARPVFGGPRVEIELCNVPPVRVFCWRRD
jgi:phospholipid N-methyltransferase